MRRYVINGALLVVFVATIATPNTWADVIVPPEYALTEGKSDNCWPLTCDTPEGASGPLLEYQQIYDSSGFATNQLISAMAFRPDGLFGSEFTAKFNDVVIQLGITSVETDTLGGIISTSTMTTVYDGPLVLSSDFTGPTGGPKDFDVIIPFSIPYLYNHGAGNLLFDFRSLTGATLPETGFAQLDASFDFGDGTSRRWLFPANFPQHSSATILGLSRSSSGRLFPLPCLSRLPCY